MILFETILAIMFGAVLLSAGARRFGLPYPVVLAVAGTAFALVPGVPPVSIEPELVLALFVAPILMDAAFDTSPRDLRGSWLPVGSLVVVAVGITTFGVAAVARSLVPDLPWAAAIALGAIVAPPDAVAATAILRRMRPPHRLIVILEGESLLNDATALLAYRIAVAAAMAGSFAPAEALPTFVFVLLGSLVLGAVLGAVAIRLIGRFEDPPSQIILQFITTFGVWILADRLQLSAIVTIVTYAMVVARTAPALTSARIRIPAYAVWDTTVFVLQALAFVLVGLQLRPIVTGLDAHSLGAYFGVALAVLATVIVVRLAWTLLYHVVASRVRSLRRRGDTVAASSGLGDSLVVGWCGMRGIVTLAAAYALPEAFPARELILISAFTVVVGTLVIQGLTLPLLLKLLVPSGDNPVETEFRLARKASLKAAVAAIDTEDSSAADAVRREYRDMIEQSRSVDAFDTTENRLRREAIAAARGQALDLRRRGVIGDDAFHQLEEELDWLELGAAARAIQ